MTLRLNSSEYIGDTYELKNQKDDKNNANNFYDTSTSRKVSNTTLKQLHFLGGKMSYSLLSQLLPLWTGRAVNFVTSGSGWPFFHSPRGKSGISHGLNC